MNMFRKTARILAVMTMVVVVMGAVFSISLYPKKAEAFHCGSSASQLACCLYITFVVHDTTQDMVTDWHQWQRFIVFGTAGTEFTTGTARLGEHEEFMLEEMFFQRILPAMMLMTEQLTSLMAYQTMIIGTFFDAKQQLETQALYQKLTARAHKDYSPSTGMCMFGTNVRSVAAAEYNADFTKMVMNERFLDRQLGNEWSVGGGSGAEDLFSPALTPVPTPYNRLGYFLQNTCDNNDINREPGEPDTGLFFCNTTEGTGWMNRDIDFTNTVMGPRIINVDFKDNDASDNSRVFEMSNYLYGHETPDRIQAGVLKKQQNQSDLQFDRALTAKRSVAQNSFNALVGLKSRGTRDSDPAAPDARNFSSEGTSEYMHFILQQLGISDDTALYWNYMSQKNPTDFSGGDTERNEMSYYAQMEILAKRIYQRPEFYTELYDKPANVKRKAAALQGISMMLERDIYDSYLRSEAIMSLILEARVAEAQSNVENILAKLSEINK